jgi:hypothetical protein
MTSIVFKSVFKSVFIFVPAQSPPIDLPPDIRVWLTLETPFRVSGFMKNIGTCVESGGTLKISLRRCVRYSLFMRVFCRRWIMKLLKRIREQGCDLIRILAVA